MADEVIETLSLDITAKVTGQAKVNTFQSSISNLSTALKNANRELERFNKLSKLSASVKASITNPVKSSTASPTPAIDLGSEVSPSVQAAKEHYEDFKKSVQSVGEEADKAKKALTETGKESEKAGAKGSSAFGKFFKSIARIAGYRLIRTVMKEISEGLREGTQNLARYSSEFNKTMSGLSTTSLYAKNAFATATQPLLEHLIPALSQFVDWLVEAINEFNRFVAIIQGKSTYTVAVKNFVDYKSSIDGTTKSVKELKNQLLGFDELNVLNDNSSSSSSANSSGISYSDMFKEVDVGDKSSGIVDFLDDIKSHIPQKSIDDFIGSWERFKIALDNFADSKSWQIIKGFLSWTAGSTATIIIDFLTDTVNLTSSILEFLSDPSWEKFKQFTKDLLAFVNSPLDSIDLIFRTTVDNSNLPDWLKGGLKIGGMALKISLSVATLNIPSLIRLVLDEDYRKERFDNFSTAWGQLFGEKNSEKAKGFLETVDSYITSFNNTFDGAVKNFITLIEQDVSGSVVSVKDEFKEGWDYLSLTAEKDWEKLTNWYNTSIAPKLTKEYWANKLNGLTSGAREKLDELKGMFLNWTASIKTPHFMWDSSDTLAASGWMKTALEFFHLPTSIPKLKVDWYANGGFPDMGEMFIARESGPELVGRMGSRNAVANNAQIEAGIEEAAYRGFMRAQGAGGSSRMIHNVIKLGEKVLYDAVVNQNNQTIKSTGNNPLAAI